MNYQIWLKMSRYLSEQVYQYNKRKLHQSDLVFSRTGRKGMWEITDGFATCLRAWCLNSIRFGKRITRRHQRLPIWERTAWPLRVVCHMDLYPLPCAKEHQVYKYTLILAYALTRCSGTCSFPLFALLRMVHNSRLYASGILLVE